MKQLEERVHDVDLGIIRQIEPRTATPSNDSLTSVARHIVSAKRNKKETILMMGGHVVRSGVQKYIIDLMERGCITCLSMNGSVIIHDFEFALIGATTESVAKYIRDGRFGLWRETGMLNDIINNAYRDNPLTGMGEAVGRAILDGAFPHKDISLLAAARRLNIPAAVHVGIGHDIIHEHPNCDGAATGATSYNDFLLFAGVIENLEGGVIMNFGSAVTAPEVFLKALSMARNVALQGGKHIRHFAALVCDLQDIPNDFNNEPPRGNVAYYFRPWKTMLVRTVSEGGCSYYVKGRHADTVPALWNAINEVERTS